jgi:hypothetical protein
VILRPTLETGLHFGSPVAVAPARIILAFLLLCLPACSSAPSGEGIPSDLELLRVEVLDDWFVRVDGERLARDEFIYRTRVDCRGRGSESPGLGVMLVWSEDEVPSAEVQSVLRTQLRLAGVEWIFLGDG